MTTVHGVGITEGPGCAHWHSPLDVVAIKLACCDLFYACFDCHQACAGHTAVSWPRADWCHREAILCRACRHLMTIEAYMQGGAHCPSCNAAFNTGCRKHWPLYFDGASAA